MIKRLVIAGTLTTALSVAACGTADPLNNGDSAKPTASASAKLEGDSLPLPPLPTATPKLPTGTLRWVKCPGHGKTYRACFIIKK